jgi:hypothetical protein
MIALDLHLPPVRTSALSRTIEAVYARDASEMEIRPPGRGDTSAPVTEWLAIGPEAQGSNATLKFSLPDFEWTRDREGRFVALAEREATGDLSPKEGAELENLSGLRRRMKNPRSGEELVWEYEQRELTRDLVRSLDRYVTFHKISHRTASAEA